MPNIKFTDDSEIYFKVKCQGCHATLFMKKMLNTHKVMAISN